MDNTACAGTEAELLLCAANEVGVHNCDHTEDAGAICAPLIIPPSEYYHIHTVKIDNL